MHQLANAIQAHLDTLVDQYDARLQTMPGYVNFPTAARRDLERQILKLVAKCLTVGDSQELVQYVRQRATHWAAAGLEITWFQAALIVPEEILVPLIESVEASTFVWQALNRSQAAVWQLVADRLQQSEERFSRFAAATEEALLFHEQGKILDVNPAMLTLFGYAAASDIIGRNMLEFIVPEARALVLQKMQLDDVQPYEVQCLHKDGSIFPVETSTRAYQHGEQTIRASSVRDITKRKRAEEATRDSAEKLRAIYEGTNDAVMLLSEQGFFDCNSRTLEMFGFKTREDFITVHPADVSPPVQPDGQESLTASQAQIQTAYRQGYNRFEWTHRRANGDDFPAEVLLSAFDFGGQRVLQATVRDITERKYLERQIQESLARRGRQVQMSIEVAQEIAAAPELSELFERVVTLTTERFNYYHTQILRYDSAKAAVILVAGYGEVGRRMHEAGHQLPMGRGVVGMAAETGRSILAADVTQDPDWRPNPHLPETKGELAVPIKLRDQVLGILDVQSNRTGALTDDDRLLVEGLCGQIATAMESTRLLNELQANEVQLSQALKIAKLAYWEYDVAKDLFLFNDQFYAIFHTTAEQEGGYQLSSARYAQRFVHPDDLAVVGSEIERAMTSADRHYRRELNHRILYTDGGVGYISVSINIDRDEQGKILRYYGANQDITERKRVEAALHASEEKYRDLINGMNDTICVIDFDTTIVDVNNAATRVLGYTRDELLSLKIPDIDTNLAPDQIQNLASSMPHDKVQVFETWHKTKTGERLPVEVSSSLVSYGGQTVILSIARDITERKHSEETLRRSQAELSQALQIAKLGYWEYDVAKDLFLLNDQFYAIFHTTAEQAGGYQLSSAQYARQFVYPDDLPVVGAEIEKALSSTDRHYSRQIDHRILYADGRVGYISVNINIDRDEQGQILRYYGANQDITERKQAEIALAREQSLMDALMLNAPDTLYFKDLNSRFIRISQSQALHFGLNDPAEAIGKSDFDFFTEEHARPAFEDEQQIMRTGLSLTKEEVETWQDRTPTWVLTTKLPLRDEAGNIVGTFGMSKDITERKLAEAGREKLLTEQRRRAFQLQTAAEVSRATSSILSVDELLPQAAELIRARFDLYYVGIFLNDEADQWAVLRAGTGDAGQQMLANGHRLKIGRRSMISQCIVNQQARIALDVGEEAVRFDNPQLPMTRSELALPLVSRGHVIGAVTIQSDQPAAFTTDDITVLQTMADQIGNAIENARLYEQSSAALREIDDLNRRLTGEGWETYLQLGSNRQLILARDNEALAPAALTAVDEQLAAGQIVVEPTPGAEQQTTVSVPVMLRGQTIGALRIAMPQAAYTNELRTTLEALAGHVAQAAENARLLDETQARFARERALGSATEKIRSRSDVEHILKTAAEELAHYLQASAINVRLGSSVTAGDKTGQPG